MPPRPSKEIMDFMKKYGVDSDEIWCVHGSTWVVKHKALERIAIQQGITFDRPAILEHNTEKGIAAICTFGKMGDRSEWSIGEASPKNNKNAYIFAIAEKRSRDRVILKLLQAHGDLYSEDEADDFKEPPKRQNPHVNRAEELHDLPPPEDRIEPDPAAVQKLRVVDQRPIFAELQTKIWNTSSLEELAKVKEAIKDETGKLSEEWRKHLNGVYNEHKRALVQQAQADDARMAG